MAQGGYDREALKQYGATPQAIQEAFLREVQAFDRVFQNVPRNQPWRAGGWTALQVQGHLIKTHDLGTLILTVLESNLPHHRLLHHVAALQQRLTAPKTITRLKAPGIVQLEASETELARRWKRSNEKFLRRLQQSHLTGNRTFPHMYIGELTALEWAQFVPYHLRHHLPQLEALQARN